MKYDIDERNIPNTFAPTCENKMFSISDIVGGLKFGIFVYKKFPKDVARHVWAEHARRVKTDQKKHDEETKKVKEYKAKPKQDCHIRYLAEEYLNARNTSRVYWMVEKVCTLQTFQLKKFLYYLADMINEDLLDKRTEEIELSPNFLSDEFLDKIPSGDITGTIERICKLDDSKNQLLSFLSSILGRVGGYYEIKSEISHV